MKPASTSSNTWQQSLTLNGHWADNSFFFNVNIYGVGGMPFLKSVM
jgi:hypothetical protein